jgi:hypothetical protein
MSGCAKTSRPRQFGGESQSAALASREPLVDHLAAIIDAGGPRLGAVSERLQQVGQLRVAVLLEEPRHTVAPVPIARLADNRERRREDI